MWQEKFTMAGLLAVLLAAVVSASVVLLLPLPGWGTRGTGVRDPAGAGSGAGPGSAERFPDGELACFYGCLPEAGGGHRTCREPLRWSLGLPCDPDLYRSGRSGRDCEPAAAGSPRSDGRHFRWLHHGH